MNKKITLSIALMLMANANATTVTKQQILDAVIDLADAQEAQQANQTDEINQNTEEVGAANLLADIADNAEQTRTLTGTMDTGFQSINNNIDDGVSEISDQITGFGTAARTIAGDVVNDINTHTDEAAAATIAAGVEDNKNQTQKLTDAIDQSEAQIQQDINSQTYDLKQFSEQVATDAVGDTQVNIEAATTAILNADKQNTGDIVVNANENASSIRENDNANASSIIENDNANSASIMDNDDTNTKLLSVQSAKETDRLYDQNKNLSDQFAKLQAEGFEKDSIVALNNSKDLMVDMINAGGKHGPSETVMLNPIANNTVTMDYASPSLSEALGTTTPGMQMPITMDLSGNTISTQLSPSFASSNAANASAMGDTTTNAVYNNFNEANDHSTHSTTHETTYNNSLNTSGGLN